jgi:hypothetical protein
MWLVRRGFAICPECGCRAEARGHAQACQMRGRVVELRASGMTMGQIGQELGISRQRVHQILSETAVRRKLSDLMVARGLSLGLQAQETPTLSHPYMRTSELLKVMALRGKWRREENQKR